MTCPTCNHETRMLCSDDDFIYQCCERCGTIVRLGNGQEAAFTPWLAQTDWAQEHMKEIGT
jgi:hypothetical protein